MKFKVGDKVRVKSYKELKNIYEKDEPLLIPEMFLCAGQTFIIKEAYGSVYWLNPWFWPESCLELAFDIDINKGALGELLNG